MSDIISPALNSQGGHNERVYCYDLVQGKRQFLFDRLLPKIELPSDFLLPVYLSP